ncbi:glycosyltransferase 87 family protein [Pseudofrankia sp. EUN1h]|uniref:glycosyltransferase 87 family protein n=2 Tax=Pseudofrankia TaxID=2994363 RepID=UPI000D08F87C|nr:glycosyltransferase 87 family protein [Pseudofrankia sp. EUN1h]
MERVVPERVADLAAHGGGAVPPAGVGESRGWSARAMGRWREPWSRRRLWTFWAASRAVLLTLVFAGRVLGAQQGVLGDVRLYAGWGEAFVHSHGLPVADETWQYPPGAVLVFAVPALVHAVVGLSYRVGFPLFMVAIDAAVTAALARAGGRPGLPGPGARIWLVGTLLLGPVTLARFDLVPAACVVAGLLALGAGRPGRTGFAAMVGTLVKAWPAFLLVAVGRPSARALARMAVGAAVAVAAVGLALVAAGAGGDLLGFLGAQRARGLQLEAVPATVLVVIRMFGAGETARYSYGSLQFGDSTARTVATVCTVVELVVVAAVVVRWWLLPARTPAAAGAARAPADASAGWAVIVCDRLLALLLVVLVTSRVLSPQYLLWVLAVAVTGVALAAGTGSDARAGAGADPATSEVGRDARGRRRTCLVMLLAVVAISQLVYPWRYNDVIQGRVVMSLVLVGRNALLLVATWHAVRVSLARPGGEPVASPRRRWP